MPRTVYGLTAEQREIVAAQPPDERNRAIELFRYGNAMDEMARYYTAEKQREYHRLLRNRKRRWDKRRESTA